eukprot:GEMP01124102.1.p1 GENE.GEMP01124102.1~~GEMP01124102.1.p1  ORF type:complete len:107 (-),score=1.80 GEMP01124102.1:72-392(-)
MIEIARVEISGGARLSPHPSPPDPFILVRRSSQFHFCSVYQTLPSLLPALCRVETKKNKISRGAKTTTKIVFFFLRHSFLAAANPKHKPNVFTLFLFPLTVQSTHC